MICPHWPAQQNPGPPSGFWHWVPVASTAQFEMGAHSPELQNSLFAQARPQPPQLAGSDSVFKHAPPAAQHRPAPASLALAQRWPDARHEVAKQFERPLTVRQLVPTGQLVAEHAVVHT